MSYYATNAVYEQLEANPNSQLIWASGNAWVLIYGDSSARARMILFVTGESMQRASSETRDRLVRVSAAARGLAIQAGLPFGTIGFDDLSEEIDSVELNGARVSLPELQEWFSSVGVPVSTGAPSKAINSQKSSAYHDWQRRNLGAITVSDIDLIRLGADDRAIEIIELKRSYYALDRWQPFAADYPNFNLISDVSARVGARFTIAYNQRVKSPRFVDDASKLRLFSYAIAGGAKSLGEFTFEQFSSGAY